MSDNESWSQSHLTKDDSVDLIFVSRTSVTSDIVLICDWL